MLLLMIAGGYIAAAVAFYTYIVVTAEEEPDHQTEVVIDTVPWRRRHDRDEELRHAA